MSKINKIRYNGTDYDITDGETYSTEEQEIGKWIDGKPIYRKIFTGVSDSSNEQSIEDNASYIDSCIRIYGNFIRISDNLTTPIGSYFSDLTGRCFYHGGTKKIFINKSDGFKTSWNYMVVVEYTKITD